MYTFSRINQGKLQLNNSIHNYYTRSHANVHLQYHRLSRTKKNPDYIGALFFNTLPSHIKNSGSSSIFKRLLKTYLILNPFYSFPYCINFSKNVDWY